MMQYRFVDRVLQIDAQHAGTIATLKTFGRNEDYFSGTFRDREEVPSSLLLESMAFAGGLLLCVRSQYTAQGVLLKVNRATFSDRVRRGEQITVRSRLVATQGDWILGPASAQAGSLAQTQSQCFLGDRQVAEGDLLFLGVSLATTLGSRQDEIVAGVKALVSAL